MPTEKNYLEQELYNLIKTDDSIFTFMQEGSLDGIWYWDIEKPENEWMSPNSGQILDMIQLKKNTFQVNGKI